MRYIGLLCVIMLFNFALFGQEIGSIKDGDHIVQLHKVDNQFSCFYSDANAALSAELKSFQFPNIEHVYDIIIHGFDSEKDHKTYVLTNKDTVVRFEFNRINGVVQVKIKHNNLTDNIIGSTTALNKGQIRELFGMPVPN